MSAIILSLLKKSFYYLQSLRNDQYKKDDQKSTILLNIFLNFPIIIELIRIVCIDDNIIARDRITEMIKMVYSIKSDIGISFQTILLL